MKYDAGVPVYKVEPKIQSNLRDCDKPLVPKIAKNNSVSREDDVILDEIVDAFMDAAFKFASSKYCIHWEVEGLRADLRRWIIKSSP